MSNDIRDMLNNIRTMKYGELDESDDKFVEAYKKTMLAESRNEDDDDEEPQDAVPYTKEDDIYTTSVESAKSGFSAKFKVKHAVLYYPEDDDVVMSGTIPSLKNAKFQFRYKDGSGQGCYIWVDSLQLSSDVLTTLTKVLGVFKNWKDSLDDIDDLRPMSMED